MSIEEEKIDLLEQCSLRVKTDYIPQLCSLREDLYEIKRAEWLEKCDIINKTIKQEAILLFIGPYSSGKSTLVNMLLGQDILPTANKPCTAVVTEVIFKDGESGGKIIKRSSQIEEMSVEELKDKIDGSTGASGEIAEWDHVELTLDINDMEDPEKYRAFVGRMRFVDCPGYGSPYFANEDVIENYIEKSSFTFWLSPFNRIGGKDTKEHLNAIRKKTSTLIPVITMTDLISDEDQKQRVIEEYYDELGIAFKRKEPILVSVKKYNEYLKNTDADDETNEFEHLRIESGIDNIKACLYTCSTNKNIDNKKIESVKYDICELLKQIYSCASEEVNHWDNKLSELGWNKEDTSFKQLEKAYENAEKWIKKVSEKAGAEIKQDLKSEVLNNLGKKNVELTADTIKGKFSEKINQSVVEWGDSLKKFYFDEANDFNSIINVKETKFNDMGAEIQEKMRILITALTDAVQNAGPRSILYGACGFGMMTAAAAVKDVALIGSALAGICTIAGPLLLMIATVPLIPTVINAYKTGNENYRQKIENQLQLALNKVEFSPLIESALKDTNRELYDYVLTKLNSKISVQKRNWDSSKSIVANIKEDQNLINKIF